MTAFPVFSDLPYRIVELVTQELETVRPEDWPGESASAAEFLRAVGRIVRQFHDHFHAAMSSGVEGNAFVRMFGHIPEALTRLESQLAALIQAARRNPANDRTGTVLREAEAAAAEATSLRQAIEGVLILMKAPPRPIDWERVRAAEEAYARGETRPVSEGFLTRPD